MALKKFKISYPDLSWDCLVELDEDQIITGLGANENHQASVKDLIKQMVEFWHDWENFLKENDGDYLTAFLKMLGQKILLLKIEYGGNIQQGFVDSEGWVRMVGSYGIKIISADDVNFNESDFVVEERIG